MVHPVQTANNILTALRKAESFVSDHTRTVFVPYQGKTAKFATNSNTDYVQRIHQSGRFYEQEELEIVRRFLPPGSTYLDIGSNVGNHLVYVGTYLAPRKMWAVEPNPDAIVLLLANLALNDLTDITDLRAVGYGLSDANADDRKMQYNANNMGAAVMVAGGHVKARRGDAFFANETIDFIKIDVEGSELAVLNGLADTIANNRPVLFVEVDTENDTGFKDWLQSNGYEIRQTLKRHAANINYFATPITNKGGAAK